jgi:pilus assembly protein CpaE
MISHRPTIVILDPNPETRAEAHRTLALANLTVLTEGGHGVDGHTLVAEAQPDCVLLALEQPVERGLQTLEALVASYPEVPVVVYSSIDDGASVRRAMLAGASDYLALPLNGRGAGEAIVRALERAHQAAPSSAETGSVAIAGTAQPAGAGMVITVFGVKGGIGKTTIATNLSMALAQESGASVALVDMDTRFGDVAIMLDIAAETSLGEAAHDVEKLDRTTIQRYLTRHSSGVSVLPASTDPAHWDAVAPEQIERIVHLLAQTHDYVILDTPGAFNEVVALSLDLANLVLLVTSLDMASIKDTSVMLNMLRSWSYPAEKVRLTVNHANLANSVNEADIARTLDYHVFWSIPYDRSVIKSTQNGQPLVLWRPNSRVARNLTQLAALVGGSNGRVAPAGLGSRWRGLLRRKV